MNDSTSMTSGIHHLGLTVTDVAATSRFFVEALGFTQVAERPAYQAIFVSDGTVMLTLWQAADPGSAGSFDRKANVGLHHFALKVADLDKAYERLSSRDDVTVEFPPEALGDGPTRHMMCSIPGGPRMELISPAQ